jgi:hypothetical protein
MREVGIRSSEPVGDRARDGTDPLFEILVQHEGPAGDARDQLHGTVVVGRPEAAGDQAEVGLEALPERELEVLWAVAHDRDASRLQSEAHGLGGEKRSVPVLPLPPDELGARDDDRRPRAAQEVARATLCEVTTNVVPFGSSTRLPFTRTTTFWGFASASWKLRPSNDCRWPSSSVPL